MASRPPEHPSQTLRAPAKLNLFLEVLGRRPDGYHEIDSLMVEIDLADSVEIEAADSISLDVGGPESGGIPADQTNLAWRAAEALGVGAKIRIEKQIPAGGGLGGGSSDAATVLRGLNDIYGLGLSGDRLSQLGTGLGADVPFFLTGGWARCRGIGERVESVPAPGVKKYLLVLPGIPSLTADVYAALDAGLTENPLKATVSLAKYLDSGRGEGLPHFNRLQGAAERIEPRLRAIREDAESRFGMSFTLTGSGSSYFAEVGAGASRNPIPAWTVVNVPVRALWARSV
ncbi:MAG: 4-(cytidine 5'-diphospho)-2-C-methyl-D-erythritol kinase [Planctomycetota bacterium]|jgi:4-diphosphocytidyl-2-C-methyl-D-erythritol kinase